METLSQKTQLVLQDWSIGRAIAWLAKLGIFVLVPGLHQIACKRYVLGALLLGYFLVGKFLGTSTPISGMSYIPFVFWYQQEIWNAAQLYAWILLLFDLRNIENRGLSRWFFIPVPVAILVYFLPFHDRQLPDYFIEPYGFTCPEFCKNDIVMYGYRDFKDGMLPLNQPVVLYNYRDKEFYVSHFVAGPTKEACAGDILKNLHLKSSDPYCKDAYLPLSQSHLVKGPVADVVSEGSEEYSMVGRNNYFGGSPRRVGNTHKYFVISEEITGLIGNALLTIYEWTGLDLLDLSDEFEGVQNSVSLA